MKLVDFIYPFLIFSHPPLTDLLIFTNVFFGMRFAIFHGQFELFSINFWSEGERGTRKIRREVKSSDIGRRADGVHLWSQFKKKRGEPIHRFRASGDCGRKVFAKTIRGGRKEEKFLQ